MQRRSFLQSAALLSVATATGCKSRVISPEPGRPAARTLLRPARLRAGDQVALICPSGPITESRLQLAQDKISAMGLRPRPGQHVLARHGATAGTDAERLADLHDAFADPAIKAVWAIRGGYGGTRLLPLIDYELIGRHPKLMIGYSDITAFLLTFYQRLGLAGLHAPVASSSLPEGSLADLSAGIFGDTRGRPILPLPGGATIVPGTATGPLAGGNLTLLAAMAGTPYAFDATGHLVFLEDVGEAPYRIDRMLTQLRQSAHFDRAVGFVLGDFVDCEQDQPEPTYTLRQAVTDRLGDLGVPVFLGAPFGHGTNNTTLPLGVRATLDADAGTLTLLENNTTGAE